MSRDLTALADCIKLGGGSPLCCYSVKGRLAEEPRGAVGWRRGCNMRGQKKKEQTAKTRRIRAACEHRRQRLSGRTSHQIMSQRHIRRNGTLPSADTGYELPHDVPKANHRPGTAAWSMAPRKWKAHCPGHSGMEHGATEMESASPIARLRHVVISRLFF